MELIRIMMIIVLVITSINGYHKNIIFENKNSSDITTESDSSLLEYDEHILDDIYINNEMLSVLSSGRFIKQITEMYTPSNIEEDGVYYNIKNGRQLKITTYDDGRIKGMYFDNNHKINSEQLKDIKKCTSISDVKKIINDVHVFYNHTTIISSNKEKLERAFCEFCLVDGNTYVIYFNQEGEKIDSYLKRHEKD